MSLAELLDDYVKEGFCIDQINFYLNCFDVSRADDMRMLMGHLASTRSHNSAVGLLGGHNQGHLLESVVGHAISMYDFCIKTQSFYYKDSSKNMYDFSNSELKGLSLNNQGVCISTNRRLEKAWKFTTEYETD